MSEQKIFEETTGNAKLSLERAFSVFQKQSEMLEKSHEELKEKLARAEISLEEKNRELAVRLQEIESIKEKLSGTLESVADAVFLIDSDGDIEQSNKAAKDLSMIKPDNAASLFELPALAELLASNKPVKNTVVEISSGKLRKFLMISVVPMNGNSSNFNYKVISIKDISDQKALEERANREDRMAELGRVAASVAHEIRNPLGAIEGFAMLLKRDLKDMPDSMRLASKTIYAARQLNSVVGNLLNYTREIKPEKIKQDIRPLISESLDFIRPMAEDHKVELSVILCENPVISNVDPVQIKQVVTNLAVNAVEACPLGGGGEVEIRVDMDKEHAIIEVEDNGPGIEKARKKEIFEPFFTMKDGGIGLGLSLCQRIVSSHEGEIYECGEESKGAHFVMKLSRLEV